MEVEFASAESHSDTVLQKITNVLNRLEKNTRELNHEWERIKCEGKELGYEIDLVKAASPDNDIGSLPTADLTSCDSIIWNEEGSSSCGGSLYSESLLNTFDGLGELKVPHHQQVPSNITCSTLDIDIELTNAQFTKSLWLAEEAALKGEDDFKTAERLNDLDEGISPISLARIKLLKSRFMNRE